MICAHIFHVIGTSEIVLMTKLFAVACGACVPIFHIKSAREAHILIGERVDDVGEFQGSLLERWMDTRGDVRDDASVNNIWDVGGHQGTVTFAAAFAMSMSTATMSTTLSTSSKRIVGLLLETVEGGRGIDLGRQGHIVVCCGGICCEYCHLLHQ